MKTCIINKNIKKQVGGYHSRAECCCTLGEGWGRRCQRCPRPGSDEFSQLCPGGHKLYFLKFNLKKSKDIQYLIMYNTKRDIILNIKSLCYNVDYKV